MPHPKAVEKQKVKDTEKENTKNTTGSGRFFCAVAKKTESPNSLITKGFLLFRYSLLSQIFLNNNLLAQNLVLAK